MLYVYYVIEIMNMMMILFDAFDDFCHSTQDPDSLRS